METRANYALIGLFTLAVIAAAFGFVYWFSGGEGSQKRQQIRIVFSGSVSGLARGSTVTFNGIRAGEVGAIAFDPSDPRRVFAVAEVDRQAPIRSDTRAKLEFSLLTNAGTVALAGGEISAPPLQPGPGEVLPTIYADRSDFQDLVEGVRVILRRSDEVLDGLNGLLRTNEAAINRSVANLATFSDSLARNAPNVDLFLSQVGQAAERIGPLAGKLETLSGDLSDLVRSVDRASVGRIVANVEGVTRTLDQNRPNIDAILSEGGSLARRLNETAPKLDRLVADLDGVLRAIDQTKLARVVDNVDRLATTLGNSSPDIDRTIKEARALVEKLNKSADRVDAVLKGAQNFLGSASGEAGSSAFGEARTAFQEVREAARSLRAFSENLDRRVAEVSTGLTRFTNSGLREYEALAVDGRRTLNDISRAVRSLERNPQQVIFGGRPSIPEYNGNARR